MSAVEIIKLIADIGFPVVCSGIFLYLAVKTYNKQQQWLEDFMKNGSHGGHPSSEDSVALDAINDKIYQELRGVLNALNADRSFLFLYHNGGASTSGLFFQKMSCICEVVAQGILPLVSRNQGSHRSSYSLFCDELRKKNKVSVVDLDKLKLEDGFLYQEMMARHSKASFFRSLRDIDGHVIGFIGIDYCSGDCIAPEAEIHKLLKTVSLKVSSLVDIRDEVK